MPTLELLPNEIKISIASCLDFLSLVNLTTASARFYRLSLTNEKRASLLELEESAPRCLEPDHYQEILLCRKHLPCYVCLRVLDRDLYFDPEYSVGLFALGQGFAKKRRCQTCRTRLRPKLSQLFFQAGTTWIECADCSNVKRYTIDGVHDHAWEFGKVCAECYWFIRLPPPPVRDSFYSEMRAAGFLPFAGKQVVRVPLMNARTAEVLVDELARRTSDKFHSEFMAAVSTIRTASAKKSAGQISPETWLESSMDMSQKLEEGKAAFGIVETETEA